MIRDRLPGRKRRFGRLPTGAALGGLGVAVAATGLAAALIGGELNGDPLAPTPTAPAAVTGATPEASATANGDSRSQVETFLPDSLEAATFVCTLVPSLDAPAPTASLTAEPVPIEPPAPTTEPPAPVPATSTIAPLPVEPTLAPAPTPTETPHVHF